MYLFYSLNKTQTHISIQWTNIDINRKNFREKRLREYGEVERYNNNNKNNAQQNSIEDIILRFYSLQKKTFEMDSFFFSPPSIL